MEGPNKFNWVDYTPTCKHKYEDCVWDPAYIQATYPEWYKKLFGDKTPDQAAQEPLHSCDMCKDGQRFDNL